MLFTTEELEEWECYLGNRFAYLDSVCAEMSPYVDCDGFTYDITCTTTDDDADDDADDNDSSI